MTHRLAAPSWGPLALTVTLALLTGFTAQAQGLRLSGSPPTPAPAPGVQRQADFIVAVVNSEPITNNEVRQELQRVMQQFSQQGRPAPDTQALARDVLESLINRKVQLQSAREAGIRADDAAVDQAELAVARQNQLDPAGLRQRLVSDGLSVAQFRRQLQDQILVTRLREREVDARVRVSDLEVEQYVREQQNATDSSTQEINLAQILVAVPDSATQVQIDALQARAQRALDRARGGADFVALVREFSDAPDLANGGQMGLRSASRYPPLFLEFTRSLGVGEISGLVRSGAGFHILKVIEKNSAGLPSMTVTQSRARHILLRPTAQQTEGALVDKLKEFRNRILAGQADFAALARDNSQDGSAAQGGDLGWANPGMFVPEFEAVMNRLTPNQISEPLVSRFGVHLIQLTERRNTTLNPSEQRETVRNILREKKLDEAYALWLQDLRGRAYVELREPPL